LLSFLLLSFVSLVHQNLIGFQSAVELLNACFEKHSLFCYEMYLTNNRALNQVHDASCMQSTLHKSASQSTHRWRNDEVMVSQQQQAAANHSLLQVRRPDNIRSSSPQRSDNLSDSTKLTNCGPTVPPTPRNLRSSSTSSSFTFADE